MSLKKRKSGYYHVPIIIRAENGITYYTNSIAGGVDLGRISTDIHQTHVQEHVFEERLLREYEAQFIQVCD